VGDSSYISSQSSQSADEESKQEGNLIQLEEDSSISLMKSQMSVLKDWSMDGPDNTDDFDTLVNFLTDGNHAQKKAFNVAAHI